MVVITPLPSWFHPADFPGNKFIPMLVVPIEGLDPWVDSSSKGIDPSHSRPQCKPQMSYHELESSSVQKPFPEAGKTMVKQWSNERLEHRKDEEMRVRWWGPVFPSAGQVLGSSRAGHWRRPGELCESHGARSQWMLGCHCQTKKDSRTPWISWLTINQPSIDQQLTINARPNRMAWNM